MESPVITIIRDIDYLRVVKQSTRTAPIELPQYPLGTLRLSRFNGRYGQLVSVLSELQTNQLQPSEAITEKKREDSARYVQWHKQGFNNPPPIDVAQDADGNLKIMGGHRRWLTHSHLEIPIKAWVLWCVRIPHLEICTSLTLELWEAMGRDLTNGASLTYADIPQFESDKFIGPRVY